MKDNIRKKLISNSFWMMASKIYSMLVSLVVGSLSARYLGPSNYGLLNYGTAIISFFTTVSALGFSFTIVVDMVKKPEKAGSYLGTALVTRFVTAMISFVGIICLVSILEPDNKLLQAVTALQAISVVMNTYEVLLYWFQMKLQMRFVTIASMVALTVTGIWRISLLIFNASVEFFALSNSITALVCGGIVAIIFFKNDHPKLTFSIIDGKYLLKESYHFIISGLAVTLYSQLDRIMLGKMISTEMVGYYSAAMVIATMWEFVPQALINSARPVITELKQNNEEEYLKKYKLLLLSINMLGLLVSVSFMIFGGLAINILYGASYAPATAALKILIWSTSFSMIGTARVVWLVNEGIGGYEKYFTIMGSVVNIILNALFIPIWGITGASVTTLVSQLFVALVAPLLFKKTKPFVVIYFDSFKEIGKLFSIVKTVVKDKGVTKISK